MLVPVTMTFIDKEVVSQCSTYVKVITRTWTATDAYGNKTTCEQIINITRTISDGISTQLRWSWQQRIRFSVPPTSRCFQWCAPPWCDRISRRYCCPNIMYFYNDVIFNICGASKKVLRQWTVIDWCTGRDTIGAQIIKIIDIDPPMCPFLLQTLHLTSKPTEGKCHGTFYCSTSNVASFWM